MDPSQKRSVMIGFNNVSFTEDFVIATNTRKIEYEPFAKDWEEKRDTMP